MSIAAGSFTFAKLASVSEGRESALIRLTPYLPHVSSPRTPELEPAGAQCQQFSEWLFETLPLLL